MDHDSRPSAFEFFNECLEAFRRADFPTAVLLARGGFFENLYLAPKLLGEETYPQKIWYAGAQGEPRAADEYLSRYGHLWRETPAALEFLKSIWNDSLVRAELRRFLSLSKNLLGTKTDSQFAELIRERGLFSSPERLKRTQAEILARLEAAHLPLPAPPPRLGLVILASRDPQASVAFFRKLLGVEPVQTSGAAGGYAEFVIEGVHLAIHGKDTTAAGDPYRLGPPPESFGWGALFVISVADFDRVYGNAMASKMTVLDGDFVGPEGRSFVVKDPSGYLVEITEERPGARKASVDI